MAKNSEIGLPYRMYLVHDQTRISCMRTRLEVYAGMESSGHRDKTHTSICTPSHSKPWIKGCPFVQWWRRKAEEKKGKKGRKMQILGSRPRYRRHPMVPCTLVTTYCDWRYATDTAPWHARLAPWKPLRRLAAPETLPLGWSRWCEDVSGTSALVDCWAAIGPGWAPRGWAETWRLPKPSPLQVLAIRYCISVHAWKGAKGRRSSSRSNPRQNKESAASAPHTKQS